MGILFEPLHHSDMEIYCGLMYYMGLCNNKNWTGKL